MTRKEYIAEIADSIDKLRLYETELNITEYNETEKKIFWTICSTVAKFQRCNISDVINHSKLSRSTVYKTILLFEKNSLISVHRSGEDKRQHLITIITY